MDGDSKGKVEKPRAKEADPRGVTSRRAHQMVEISALHGTTGTSDAGSTAAGFTAASSALVLIQLTVARQPLERRTKTQQGQGRPLLMRSDGLYQGRLLPWVIRTRL